ncbi:MAG: FAD-binding oxidoreductase [Deltaproteobacteria bacterium]|nr:FAD-binding oxidoreductase [Deltaproteobacteria bacterium]
MDRTIPVPDKSLVTALRRSLGQHQVSVSDTDITAYSRDLWPRGMIWAMHGRPAVHKPVVVVWPKDLEQVRAVMKIASRHSVPVIPYGAGSGVCAGTLALAPSIMMDLKKLDKVSLDKDSWTVHAGAGCMGQVLEDFLNQAGCTLGHFPSSIYCSSVGGWLATRSAGQMSGKYGKIEDMVLGFEAVTSDGEVIDIRDEQEAPGLVQLLIGNEGILCAFTKARLRVHPLPESRIFQAFGFDGIEAGLEAIRLIYRAGLRPSVTRLYDELDSLVARSYGIGRGKESRFRDVKLPGVLARALPDLSMKAVKAVLGRPVVINKAIRLLPSDCMLILGSEGAKACSDEESRSMASICESLGGRNLGPEPGEHWFKHRYSVSYKQSKVFRSGAFVDTMEVAAPWNKVADVYHEVKKALEQSAFIMAHFSHAYMDGCSIYFTFSAAPWGGATLEEVYKQAWRTALDAASRAGATISHHHGIGYSKSAFMKEEVKGGQVLLSALKRELDKRGIMNPGKLGMDFD